MKSLVIEMPEDEEEQEMPDMGYRIISGIHIQIQVRDQVVGVKSSENPYLTFIEIEIDVEEQIIHRSDTVHIKIQDWFSGPMQIMSGVINQISKYYTHEPIRGPKGIINEVIKYLRENGIKEIKEETRFKFE